MVDPISNEQEADEPEIKKAGWGLYVALVLIMAAVVVIFLVANHFWPA